jgi:hypothetical protein
MSQEFYECIDNLTLLENNLYHIEIELNRENLSYFRIARESHQALYRSMVEALRGSANLAITGRPKSKDKSVKYQKGNERFKEIHKITVNGCENAWRYSEPQVCEPPKIDYKKFDMRKTEDYLKSFYDLLAMMQTECFMGRFVHSKLVYVDDKEMKLLEWLHEYIRNEYEHFIPKSYLAPRMDLTKASAICIKKCYKLIFESGNVIPNSVAENIQLLLNTIRSKLFELLDKQQKLINNADRTSNST